MAKDIREGLAYAVGDPTLRGLIVTLLLPAFFGFSMITLLPAWAREAMQVQAEDLGVLMMFLGGGSLIGSTVNVIDRSAIRFLPGR